MSKEKYRSFEVDSYSIDDKLEPQITQEMNELGLDEEQQGFVWGALMFGPRWIMSLLHGLIC